MVGAEARRCHIGQVTAPGKSITATAESGAWGLVPRLFSLSLLLSLLRPSAIFGCPLSAGSAPEHLFEGSQSFGRGR